jgi:hypothetical protein
MKNRFKTIIFSIYLTIFAMNSTLAESNLEIDYFSESVSSSDPGGHDTSDDPVPAAPINSQIIILLFLAFSLGFTYRNKLKNNIK